MVLRRTGPAIACALAVVLMAGSCSAGPAESAPLGDVLGRDSATAAGISAAASPAPTSKPRSGETPGPPGTAPAPVPPITLYGFPGSVILGRPTATSVALSVLTTSNLAVYAEYGAASGRYTARTATASVKAGQPAVLALAGLKPDAATFYRLRYRPIGQSTFRAAAEQSFRTQRAAGSAFTFAVDADPHVDVDGKMQPALFRVALANVRAARPDFLIDLGDTFLGDKFATSWAELKVQYANVRNYFGIVGPSTPLFLVNGNHEGEDGWRLNGTADNLAVWAANLRKAYYPVPAAGTFYSGSPVKAPFVGERASYYAWEWGDALFVVLDPYSYSTTNPKQSGDPWDWTLGEAQYRWLAKVLSTSRSTYKFVFSHHALGDVRGGIEWAELYEWGGSGKDGTYQFDARRPGWGLPIHRLFVEHGVTIFFQGHDHYFVRQELDGVVYQEVPQPATVGDPQNKQHENAYRSGVIVGSPGHLQVTVGSAGVTVAYVRSNVAPDGTPGAENGKVVYRYTVARPDGE